MEHAQPARVEVLAGVRGPDQLAVRQVQRDRVDGEVAAFEVLAQRGAELHLGQRPRPLVALPARAGQVERRPVEAHGGGPEALVRDDATAGAARDRHRVALDDEVELVRIDTKEEVADGAADHVDGVLAVEGGDGGRAAETLQEIHLGHLGGWLTCL